MKLPSSLCFVLAASFRSCDAFAPRSYSHGPRNNIAFLSKSKILSVLSMSSDAKNYDYALLFDCDGVILETEEFHRLAYNAAFDAAQLTINGKAVHWDVEYYDMLQNTIGGGKPKMFFHFRNTMGGTFPMSGNKAAPTTVEEEQALIDSLQEHKTKLYKEMVEEKAVCRPGVLELMDEALADPSIAVGVCSASTKESAQKTLSVTLGEDRVNKLDVCILGDDVSEKKPSPLIYNFAREQVNVPPERCVVIEDSLIGLKAAKGAGMKCLITYTASTKDCDFYGEGADAKIADLSSGGVTLESIFGPLKEKGVDATILENQKEPVV